MPLPFRRHRTAPEPTVADVARRRLAGLRAQLAAERGEDLPPPPEAAAPADVAAGGAERSPGDLSPASVPESVPAPGRHARRPVGPLHRFAAWSADRAPVVLGARPGLGSAQVGLVCLVLALGLVAAAWWALRAHGSDGTVAPPRVTSAQPDTASGSPVDDASPDPTASSDRQRPGGRIVVDVVGRVIHRGIVVLPAGSRVVDAVRAAGGLRPGVNRTSVNFARVLTDGEQLLVGVGGAPAAPAGGAPSSAASPTTLVNINTADQATLETLPGIGPVTATAILQWRDEHGSFSSVDELLEVDGIGEATLADIAPLVTL